MRPSDDEKGLTIVDVYTVNPANQERLIGILTDAADGFVRRKPGYVSSTLYCSIEGKKVTICALAQHRGLPRHASGSRRAAVLEEALGFATFDHGVYTTVRTFPSAPG